MRRGLETKWRSVCLAACVWLVATNAFADARQDAERHFAVGVSLQKVEDFDAAVTAYQASVASLPTKSALFNLANCLKAIHRYAEALDALERLKREFGGELDPSMAAAADALDAKLRPLTGTLRVNIEPATPDPSGEQAEQGGEQAEQSDEQAEQSGVQDTSRALLRIDGQPAADGTVLRLSIGQHRLRVERPGYEIVERELTLRSGEQAVLSIELQPLAAEPAPVPPPPTGVAIEQPPGPKSDPAPAPAVGTEASVPTEVWLTGAGSVLLLGAAVTGVWALSLDQELGDYCVAGHCGKEREADISRLETLALTTDVLAGVGLGLCLGGLATWMLSGEEPSAAPARQSQRQQRSVQLEVGPGSVFVTGEF